MRIKLMTEIKRYSPDFMFDLEMVVCGDGEFVAYEDHAAIVAALQEQLSQFPMSAGHADQRKAESVAVRVALGFSADADDVAPCDLVDAIASLQEQVRAQAVEGFADYIALYNSNSKHHALDYATRIRAGEQP
ncbi:hypothetical protein VL73_2 [Erwinia phage VL73]